MSTRENQEKPNVVVGHCPELFSGIGDADRQRIKAWLEPIRARWRDVIGGYLLPDLSKPPIARAWAGIAGVPWRFWSGRLDKVDVMLKEGLRRMLESGRIHKLYVDFGDDDGDDEDSPVRAD